MWRWNFGGLRSQPESQAHWPEVFALTFIFFVPEVLTLTFFLVQAALKTFLAIRTPEYKINDLRNRMGQDW